MSLNVRLLVAAASTSLPLVFAEPAWADASSWMFAGGGVISWKQGDAVTAIKPAIQLDVGVGTDPDARFIFGGLFRVNPIIGNGTDLALMLRAATKGFQAGGFGLALDAGGYARFWGIGSEGFVGSLTLGAPFGLTLTGQASVGTDSALAYGAVLGIDFLRLTVYRRTMLDVWTNPYPAGGEVARRGGALTF